MNSRYLGENRVEVSFSMIERIKILFGIAVNGYILVGREVRNSGTGHMMTVEYKYEMKVW